MNHYLKISKSSIIFLVIMLMNAGNAKAQENVITFDIFLTSSLFVRHPMA